MNRRETDRILAVIRDATESGRRIALATVVRVKGSAYRREGAHIVVREDGSYECLLSGGCLEPAVAEVAAQVIATGEPVIVEYDLAEDSVWGLGIGCGGAVDVRIERVGDDPVTAEWLDVLQRGESAVLVTPLSADAGRLIVRPDGTNSGGLASHRMEAAAVASASERLRLPRPYSGPEMVLEAELFFEVSVPAPELVIFGAGPDAVPLARQARDVGFVVTVVDPRESLMRSERFPGATLRTTAFSRLAEAVPLSSRSCVVVMNHHLERDEQSLQHALGSDARYIGVLGPRSRYYKLLVRLRHDLGVPLDDDTLGRVRSPIGLALGAETPEEIAVSILGELIALERGFDAGFLNGRETSLHRSAESRFFARS